MQQAWEAFGVECPTNWDSAGIAKEWFRVLSVIFPGKRPDTLTPAEWARFVNESPSKIIPI